MRITARLPVFNGVVTAEEAFLPSDVDPNLGILRLPMTTKFLTNDGQMNEKVSGVGTGGALDQAGGHRALDKARRA